MLKDKIKQSMENVKPNGSADLQNITLGASVLVDEVLPIIHEITSKAPYTVNNWGGGSECIYCGTDEGKPHDEGCAYERLKRIGKFFN